MLLQHTREGKDTRWHQHIQTDFIKLLRYLYLFRYLHECYQYLVKKKRHLTGRSMTDNWAKVDSFIFIFWFPPKRWSRVCHFDQGFYQPSIGRGKSWADGCARETKERRRLICSKRFSRLICSITALPAQISASNFHDLTQITQRRVRFNPKRTVFPCALG